MPEPVVRAEGLRKSYGPRVVALDGVDIDVRPAELLAITGPSGSGKSTLLSCLSGLTTPDEGRVLCDGVDLATLDDDARSDLRAERFAFVFQTLNLLPALTVAENVQLPLVLRGDQAEDIRRKTTEMLLQVGLADRDGEFPASLSVGEQQRVALARALSTDPDVLWADEPTGALDSASGEQIVALLRRAVASSRTVVVVTHDAHVASSSDRIVTMRDGAIEPG
ncbi:MAG TPA: ABC transporter ATP-binding protein [Actinomycetota bacterium]|nr:ABC transporter ATP-binding protein [Actinomycetota bacterium]